MVDFSRLLKLLQSKITDNFTLDDFYDFWIKNADDPSDINELDLFLKQLDKILNNM